MAGNEVKAVHNHSTASFATGRGRLAGFLINHSSGSSGDVVIYDNAAAASGDEVLEIDEKDAGLFGMEIPGDGILFYHGLYATIPANTTLTLFIQK